MTDKRPPETRARFAADILHAERKPLDAIFSPRNVAIIGASDKLGSVGRTILFNLVTHPFGGPVFPINPRRSHVLGIEAYPHIGEAPERVDLAVIVTPAATVPGVIGECVDSGVRGAIVISAGFKETRAEGAELERRVLEQARRGRLRLIGPNCLGVMRPFIGFNATFAGDIARPGNVGFISQSGALCTAILDWSLREHVGFSAFISIGSMLDVGWGDLIDYLGDDPYTKCIVIYMESIGDARTFLSAAREVALTKPIIVLKTGRTAAAAQAAASHTGSLAGSDEVLDAAFRRCGVLRVDTIEEVFDLAEVLAKQPRPRGPRLAIVTNAGGPAVLATDALIRSRGELAPLAPETIEKLDACLPPAWSRGDPVDILGDAPPERYVQAVDAVSKDPNNDGLLLILSPQAMTDPTRTAEALQRYARREGKPVLACWMGGVKVAAGEAILTQAGIPTFPYPDTAARIFSAMWRAAYNLRSLYETPKRPVDTVDSNTARDRASEIIQAARRAGRTLLTEIEAKQLLAAYGLPTVETRFAATEGDAAEIASEIGWPVVLKVYSETITHKTDVGGVRLNLPGDHEVRAAFRSIAEAVAERAGPEHFQGVTVQPMVRLPDSYELIVGSSIDAQFGPVLLFGTGGQLVEVLKDRALSLPPLNTTLARRMMEQTRIYQALQGVRGRPPVDLAALEVLLARFSRLIVEQPYIQELDINPLVAAPSGFLALDARVVVHGPDVSPDQLPRPAIRPYPTPYVAPWITRDGTRLIIRPIRPEDEPLMVKFHATVSERSVALRYFHLIKLSARVAHERLTRICYIDYDREMALVAERADPQTGEPEILGVGRLSKQHGANEAEFGLLVADLFQHQGLGTELLRRLVQIGRDDKLDRITADILPENLDMQKICTDLGFRLIHVVGDAVVRAVIDL